MISSISLAALVATVALAKTQTTVTLSSRYYNSTSYGVSGFRNVSSTSSSSSSSSAFSDRTEVAAFGQCGGLNYSGSTKCASGYKCVYQNVYYSNCIAIEYSTEQYAQRWSQCYGDSYTGPTECVPGFTCSVENQYYGGCFPTSTFSLAASATSDNNYYYGACSPVTDAVPADSSASTEQLTITTTTLAPTEDQTTSILVNTESSVESTGTESQTQNSDTSIAQAVVDTEESTSSIQAVETASQSTEQSAITNVATIDSQTSVNIVAKTEKSGADLNQTVSLTSSSIEAQNTFSTDDTNNKASKVTADIKALSVSSQISSSTSEQVNIIISSSTTSTESSTSSDDSSASSTSTATPEFKLVPGGLSGIGKTTQYWDCCLPAFSWNGRSTAIPRGHAVKACDKDGNPFTGSQMSSGCTGGDSFVCNDQHAWAINDDLAYGFGSISLMGATTETLACSCYKLTFNETSIAGKVLVLQATNTGGGKNVNHFDIAVPGSGVGPMDQGCTNQFGTGYFWGKQYGGISTADQCSGLPAALKSGCDFRFNWFQNANNPHVNFQQIVCPAEITAKSGCARTDQ